MRDSIGIVIQGKYNETFLKSLDHYKTFGQVVLSCYEDDKIPDNLGIEVVKCEDIIEGYNDLNIYRQCNTTLNGLEKLKTYYAIKVRTDEAWNLAAFSFFMINKGFTYTTCNIHFTNDPLHPSDHVIGSELDLLLNGFELAKKACIEGKTHSSNETLSPMFGRPDLRFGPEQVLFSSFLLANYGHWPKIDDLFYNNTGNTHMNTVMQNFSQCVKIELMQPYIWTQNYSPRRFFETTETLYDSHNPSIKQIMEYSCNVNI